MGHRCSSNLAWLWGRPAAVAPVRPLAWELPYAAGAALKSKKTKTKKTFISSKGILPVLAEALETSSTHHVHALHSSIGDPSTVLPPTAASLVQAPS